MRIYHEESRESGPFLATEENLEGGLSPIVHHGGTDTEEKMDNTFATRFFALLID